MNEFNTVDAIYSGSEDARLDVIIDAVRARRQVVGYQTAHALAVGQTVRLTAPIAPKYLRGLTAEVVGRVEPGTDRVPCRILEGAGKYQAGMEVPIPATCLQPA